MKRLPAIVDISFALPRRYISLKELAEVRGVDPDKYLIGLGCKEMAIWSPGEDTVTLAVSAASKLLERNPKVREKLSVCIVGTESGIDASKPVSIYLHQFLQLPKNCRTFEIKHACYGGTAALQSVAAQLYLQPESYALIVAADIARYDLYSPAEPTQGAGAVAILLKLATTTDSLLQIYTQSGIFSQEVMDFWRPNYQSTPVVQGKYSVQCYLDALEESYRDFSRQQGPPKELDYLLFHLPFPKIAKKAHLRLMEMSGISDPNAVAGDFERRVAPQLWGPSQIGNTYTASLYFALLSLIESKGDNLPKKNVGLFSYGSGCCSEFFAGTFGEKKLREKLSTALKKRHKVDIYTYEKLHLESLALEKNNSLRKELPPSGHPITFLGVKNHERIYRREEPNRQYGD